MLLAALCLATAYFSLILYFLWQWVQLPDWRTPEGFMPSTSVSVLVPARNEAAHIEACLRSLLAQRYPGALLEIVVVDDHSTDATASLVRPFAPRVKLLRLAEAEPAQAVRSFKKLALARGVRESHGDLIVCTDADCTFDPDWLSLMVSRYEEDWPAFLCGLVGVARPRTAFECFQALDFLGTSLITGAGHRAGTLLLANGANMAFPRSIFIEVGGFQGIDHLASGDDLLLLEKIAARYPRQTAFVKNPRAMVRTRPMPDWPSFIRQRRRWASKTAAYRDQTANLIWALVGALSTAILLAALAMALGVGAAAGPLLALLAGKALADALLLGTATRFARQGHLLSHFWIAELWHLAYVAWVGMLTALNRPLEWKGRQIN